MKKKCEQKYVFHDYKLCKNCINEPKIRIFSVFAENGSTMMELDFLNALKSSNNTEKRKRFKAL
jgi:hypothetical protein